MFVSQSQSFIFYWFAIAFILAMISILCIYGDYKGQGVPWELYL